jgi:thiol-disulfide isomerase/thioredoxin
VQTPILPILAKLLVKAGGIVHTEQMIKRFFLLCGLLTVLTVAADQLKLPILKVGTITYSNVTILGANTTDLYFSHSQGFSNVKLRYVSPELQKRFGYDAKAAAEAERKQAELEILYENNLAKHLLAQRNHAGAAKAKPAIGTETGLADPISDRSLLGKPAPKLEVEKWLGDKPDLTGKYVLLNFWAPWSLPCRQWIGDLNAIQKKYSDKLVIVGVTADPETAVTEMPDPKLDFPCAIDSKAKLSAAAGVSSVPFVLLCDPKGTVLYQGHPAALTDKKLQAILAKPAE